jgi:ATP-dependent Zn protease
MVKRFMLVEMNTYLSGQAFVMVMVGFGEQRVARSVLQQAGKHKEL